MVVRMHQHADVLRALQDGVHRLRGGFGHLLRVGLELGAHHAPRQQHRGLGHGLGHLRFQCADLFVEAVQQLAQLRRHLRGERLFEAVQRHQPVAVAVLVARLPRRGDLRLHDGGLCRRRGRRGGAAGRWVELGVQRVRAPGGEGAQFFARDEARIGCVAARRAVALRRRHVAKTLRRIRRHRRLRSRSRLRRTGGARS